MRWTAPASDGGSPITGYDIVSIPATTTQTAAAGATSFNFTGLQNSHDLQVHRRRQEHRRTVDPVRRVEPGDTDRAERDRDRHFVGDLTPSSQSSARYWRNIGTGNPGPPLKLLNTVYPKGVQVDPGSSAITLTYTLPGAFTRFQSDVGVDVNICGTTNGNVRFKVFKNSETTPLYDSGATAITSSTSPTVKIDVDITGATTLKLVVEKNGAKTCNYSDWADAKLVP